MELLDVVDENNNLIGKTEDRELIHQKGLYHREVGIWIMNEKGEILVQKRSANKKQAPNKWGVTAGHVDAGQEPIEVAIREVLEEIGLELSKEDIEFLFVVKKYKKFSDTQYNNNFQCIYFTKTNREISEYIIQEEELSEVKYISIEELEKIIENKDEKYTFSKSEYFEKLIEILKEKRKLILM